MHRVILSLLSLVFLLAGMLTSLPALPEGASMVPVAYTQTAETPDEAVAAEFIPVPSLNQYRGSAEAKVKFVPASIIPTLCGGPNLPIIACVNDIGGDTITLPNPCDAQYIGEDYAAVVCHEKGHILGWRHEMANYFPIPENK